MSRRFEDVAKKEPNTATGQVYLGGDSTRVEQARKLQGTDEPHVS